MYFIIFIIIVTIAHPALALALIRSYAYTLIRVRRCSPQNGYGHVPVYRARQRSIGCSLADSAESLRYGAWLEKASLAKNPLHVIYINTSLETKAKSTAIVPTITCTSSNVVQTMLQAWHQIPDLTLWYGPDTCMGYNLQTMFQTISETWTDEDIKAKLHPNHDRATVRKLRDNLNVFPSGNCVVHHMFSSSVVDTVKACYPDAYVSAHLEVPGEMFGIAMTKSLEGKGVVGSTADILKFITEKVDEEAAKAAGDGGNGKTLQFVLGTEAGMVSSVVSNVRKVLKSRGGGVQAEIIFPVAAEAVMADETSELGGLVPGVSGGEGCSTAGGCATCPFMKMNDIDSVMDLIQMVINDPDDKQLVDFMPPMRLKDRMIKGRPAIDVGVESILHMRHFMSQRKVGHELIADVIERSGGERDVPQVKQRKQRRELSVVRVQDVMRKRRARLALAAPN